MTCAGLMRIELWAWLYVVAMWVDEQHLWNMTRPGIPECWPAHPHVVHDLAVLACSRYCTSFAVTPAALEDWHRYGGMRRICKRWVAPGVAAVHPRADRPSS